MWAEKPTLRIVGDGPIIGAGRHFSCRESGIWGFDRTWFLTKRAHNAILQIHSRWGVGRRVTEGEPTDYRVKYLWRQSLMKSCSVTCRGLS